MTRLALPVRRLHRRGRRRGLPGARDLGAGLLAAFLLFASGTGHAETFTTRSGLPVVAATHGQPSAVVQLHAKIPPTLGPTDRTQVLAFAHALGWGAVSANRPALSQSLAAIGGRTEVNVDEDGIIVSLVVPERHLSVALAQVHARLLGRRRLLPAPHAMPGLGSGAESPSSRSTGADRQKLSEAPPFVPLEVRQVWAPAHPYSYALQHKGKVSAIALSRVADAVLRTGQVNVVVLAPQHGRLLAVLLDRHLRVRLPRASVAPLPTRPPLLGSRQIELRSAPKQPPRLSAYYSLPPPLDDRARAARQIVATQLGGKNIHRKAGSLLRVMRPLPTAGAATPIEKALEAEVAALARLTADAFENARSRAISAVSKRGRDVATVAQSLVGVSLETQLSALKSVTLADVVQLSKTLTTCPRIIEIRRAP